MKKLTVTFAQQMRNLDRQAIEEIGIPGIVLMENAGRKSAEFIIDLAPPGTNFHVICIAGKGNNGGDAFVVARHLKNHGASVKIMSCEPVDQLSGDARINADIARKMGIPIKELSRESIFSGILDELDEADFIVDGIFGTGLSQPLEGFFGLLVAAINESSATVISLDIPSGLAADQPEPIGDAVEADFTVTFGFLKPALILYPAARYAGTVILEDISIPEELLKNSDIKGSIITPNNFQEFFLPRPRDAHKGRFGHLLIIAGSAGKTGAAILSAEAAMRMGCGLVTVAIPKNLNGIIATKLTEAMSLPIPSNSGDTFDLVSYDNLIKAAEGKDAIVLGPGIGLNAEMPELIRRLIDTLTIPVVLDADGLNAIAAASSDFHSQKYPRIFTPHPGEMARLLSQPVSTIQKKQLCQIPQYAVDYNLHVVFKTARTLICSPTGEWTVNTTGNPGMASGGSGDVLSGMIGSLLAQGFSAQVAAEASVYLHGFAGDLASEEITETSLLATDLIAKLPLAIKKSRNLSVSRDHFKIYNIKTSEGRE